MRTRGGNRIMIAALFALGAGLLAANNPVPRIERHVRGEASACVKSIEAALGVTRQHIAA